MQPTSWLLHTLCLQSHALYLASYLALRLESLYIAGHRQSPAALRRPWQIKVTRSGSRLRSYSMASVLRGSLSHLTHSIVPWSLMQAGSGILFNQDPSWPQVIGEELPLRV